MTSVAVEGDSEVGAIKMHTSELRARYPVGLSVLSSALVLVSPPLSFLAVRRDECEDRGCARETHGSEARATENRVAFIYAN